MSRLKEVHVKGKVIGGPKQNICVPLVGKTLPELIEEVGDVIGLCPDIIEWRVDYFSDVQNIENVIYALHEISAVISEYPLIFTCREQSEGGQAKIDKEVRFRLILEAIRSGCIDIVDVELQTARDMIKCIVREAHHHGVHVIISHHNFKQTGTKEQIIQTLMQQQDAGADIAKVAVMPNQMQDVLNLMEATLSFTEQHAKIPAISVAMSNMGVVTRIAGALFGSSITFAAGKHASAPGQISVEQLRAISAHAN